ncbi:MAG: T9SS type A sorting domain-containing protein [Bacteroidetes bacterium]|nr:T9SS type A sorting domain-containing protein [Bacteroidota bacterium]
MSIFDITGKVVSSIQLNDELTIGSDLEPGIYFIKLQSNTGVQTYKISKVR